MASKHQSYESDADTRNQRQLHRGRPAKKKQRNHQAAPNTESGWSSIGEGKQDTGEKLRSSIRRYQSMLTSVLLAVAQLTKANMATNKTRDPGQSGLMLLGKGLGKSSDDILCDQTTSRQNH